MRKRDYMTNMKDQQKKDTHQSRQNAQDMQKGHGGKKKSRKTADRIKSILIFAVFVFAGAAGGYALAAWADHMGRDPGEFIFYLAVCFISFAAAYFLQIIIHEGGHLVFGLLSGYDFCSFRIGNFMWMIEGGKVIYKRYSLAGTGGQCLMAPPDLKDGKVPYVLYNLGGALMNLIAATICLIPAWLMDGPLIVKMFLVCMAVAGLLIALLNGIPMQAGMVNNDGQNIVDTGKNRESMYSFWLQMKIGEMQAKGMALKDMPEEWFVLPDEKNMNNAITAARAVFAENRLMEEHRFEESALLCDRILQMESAAVVGVYRALLNCDRIDCERVGGQDERVVEKWTDKRHQKVMKQMKNHLSVIRTEYAWALFLENRGAGEEKGKKQTARTADRIRERFELTAAYYPYPADAKCEKNLMETAEKVLSGREEERAEMEKRSDS